MGWSTDPSVALGHIHVLARIVGITCPGREGFSYDWDLDDITVLEPIPLPHGVGQNGRFPNENNLHLHEPFRQLVHQMAAH